MDLIFLFNIDSMGIVDIISMVRLFYGTHLGVAANNARRVNTQRQGKLILWFIRHREQSIVVSRPLHTYSFSSSLTMVFKMDWTCCCGSNISSYFQCVDGLAFCPSLVCSSNGYHLHDRRGGSQTRISRLCSRCYSRISLYQIKNDYRSWISWLWKRAMQAIFMLRMRVCEWAGYCFFFHVYLQLYYQGGQLILLTHCIFKTNHSIRHLQYIIVGDSGKMATHSEKRHEAKLVLCSFIRCWQGTLLDSFIIAKKC